MQYSWTFFLSCVRGIWHFGVEDAVRRADSVRGKWKEGGQMDTLGLDYCVDEILIDYALSCQSVLKG